MRVSRFQPEFDVTVSVDGIERDPVTIWAHQQSDPYPGGHRFEVILRDARTSEFFAGLPFSVKSRLDNRTAHDFLQRIYWAFPTMTDIGHWDFVLNTIDTVERDDGTVRVKGECSPFVSRPAREESVTDSIA